MATLKINGGELYYSVRGEGEPIVILRGLGRSSLYWHGFEKLIAKDFKVICTDARGLGKSMAKVSWDLQIDQLAADVISLLDHLGIERAHVMGVSLGGMVALALGLRHPDRVSSVTVCNTSIAGSRGLRMSLPAVKAIMQGIARPSRLQHYLTGVLLDADTPDSKRQHVAQSWNKIREQEGIPLLTAAKQIIAALRFTVGDELKQMLVPTMVIYGTADRFVPPRNSLAVHRLIPKAKLVAIAGGGHEITMGKAAEVRDALVAFAAELRKGAG